MIQKKTTDTVDYVGLDEEENYILHHASMCGRCNRNLLLEYAFEFRCLACNFVSEKTKQQLTKLQRKQQTNFSNRLTYANPKIISICMEVENILPNEYNLDLLATALTYLKQKKLNVIDHVLKNFTEMDDDYETGGFYQDSSGISRAGNDAIRMMKWMVGDNYYDNMNYYDLIATALTAMKGEKLNVTIQFFLINDRLSLRY